MRHTTEDSIKRRLTDPGKIAMAVNYLLASGVKIDMIAIELSRKFYVDIDALNAVLDKVRRPPAPAGARPALGTLA